MKLVYEVVIVVTCLVLAYVWSQVIVYSLAL